MKIKNRQQLLTFGAVAVVALFAADKLLLNPLTAAWKQRSTRVAELRSRAASGPVPTTTRGQPTRVKASTATSSRLYGVSAETQRK